MFFTHVFNFDEIQFTFVVVALAFGIITKNPFSNPRSLRVYSFCFLLRIVLALIFRSFVHLELIFVYSVR